VQSWQHTAAKSHYGTSLSTNTIIYMSTTFVLLATPHQVWQLATASGLSLPSALQLDQVAGTCTSVLSTPTFRRNPTSCIVKSTFKYCTKIGKADKLNWTMIEAKHNRVQKYTHCTLSCYVLVCSYSSSSRTII